MLRHSGQRSLEEFPAAFFLCQVAGRIFIFQQPARQISGAHEIAKDLITESIGIFEGLQQSSRVAEGQIELACCYWREGKFEEGRVWLNEALRRLSESDIQLKAKAFIRMAIIEAECKRYGEALRIHTEAAPLFQQLENHCLMGAFRMNTPSSYAI